MSRPISTGMGWLAALGVIAAFIWPALYGAHWASLLTAAVTATGIGVWRGVVLLGMILNHLHWRDVEVPAADD